MILVAGALLSGLLGYGRMGWWVPAVVVGVVLALQAVAYQGVLSTAAGLSELLEALAMTGLMSLFVVYAAFSIGRSWSSRRRGQ